MTNESQVHTLLHEQFYIAQQQQLESELVLVDEHESANQEASDDILPIVLGSTMLLILSICLHVFTQ